MWVVAPVWSNPDILDWHPLRQQEAKGILRRLGPGQYIAWVGLAEWL
jgi:hypothetical protein